MMRRALEKSAVSASRGASLPAPTGGWNARDPIASMPSSDAIVLDNFFPGTGSVDLRKGSAVFATLPDGEHCRSLLHFNQNSGNDLLFAATEVGIYDVTAGGATTVPGSLCTNGEFQFANLSNAAGNFLWCCNGVDKARYFDGSSWTVLDSTSTPALTGIASEDVVNVSLHKTRLFLCEKDSLSVWYLPVNAVAGAASEFPLGAIFPRGGYLIATGSWTLDGGNGPDDYFVAVTSEGELAVYAGTDPSNAATWALQGVYHIGAPLGRRCLLKMGGDLLVLTVRGLFPLSRALQSPTADTRAAISNKISNAWVEVAENFANFFGWQPIYFPEASFLLVNIPRIYADGGAILQSYQFVMNTQTGAWCRFVGMPSEVWAVSDGRLYFARNNQVCRAWVGGNDFTGLPIDARCRTAFLYPSGKGNLTHVKMVRPILVTGGRDVQLHLGIDDEYKDGIFRGSRLSYLNDAAFWDSAIWDESVWTGTVVTAPWRSIAHFPGRALSLRLRILGKGITLSWNATNFVLQKGGLL